MLIAVPKEIREGEKRVALVPDVINKLTRLGLDVVIESGAGIHSQASDAEFVAAGAKVESGDVLKSADVVLSVQPLTPAQMATLKKGAVTISFLSVVTATDSIDAAASAGVTAFSLELVPRISRAQSRIGGVERPGATTRRFVCVEFPARPYAAAGGAVAGGKRDVYGDV